jgi:hypothetical protein
VNKTKLARNSTPYLAERIPTPGSLLDIIPTPRNSPPTNLSNQDYQVEDCGFNSEVALFSEPEDNVSASDELGKSKRKATNRRKGFEGGRPKSKKKGKQKPAKDKPTKVVLEKLETALKFTNKSISSEKTVPSKGRIQQQSSKLANHRSIGHVPMRAADPVAKVPGRTPCYAPVNLEKLNKSTSSTIFIPETQFVDPYDFETSWEFFSGKKMRTYERLYYFTKNNLFRLPYAFRINVHIRNNTLALCMLSLITINCCLEWAERGRTSHRIENREHQ